MHRAARRILILVTPATSAATGRVLSPNPFAAPLLERTAAEADAVRATHDGAIETARDCAACAWDIAACPTLRMSGACALPVEVTPVGDLSALRRWTGRAGRISCRSPPTRSG